MRKNENETKKQTNKLRARRNARRGIDYQPVRTAVRSLADWLVDVAGEDVKGWREGERRLGDVRRYLHARIDGDDASAPAEESVLFAMTQLARAFASDPQVSAGLTALVDHIEPLASFALGELARRSRPPMPPSAAPAPAPVRPPGVPLSVPRTLRPIAICPQLRVVD
jgi:hypothetical protein